MFDRENPWSAWVYRGGFAHPDAPCRGGGYSSRPGPSLYHGGAPDPYSPVGMHVSPREAAAGYATYELKRAIDGLWFARSSEDLHEIAAAAFGRTSFSGRFCDAQRRIEGGRPLFALQKLMVQAELHDHLRGRVSWPLGGFGGFGRAPELWEVGHHLRSAWNYGTQDIDALKAAAEKRDALLKDVAAVFAQSEKVFAETRAKLKLQAGEQWVRYNELMKTGRNRDEAGWTLGIALAEVVTTVAALMKSGEYHAKLAGGAPQLTQFALEMKESATARGAIVDDAPSTASDPRSQTPYHNDEALKPEVETFKTDRPVDMNSLSPEEKAARKAMNDQGRKNPKDQQQLLSSADSFETVEAKKGDVLYGFTSSGYPKGKESMYWLTEKDYADVKASYCKDGVWDREGVKNHLALPCFNRANSVVKSEVLEDHVAVRSHIGSATERVSYSNDSFSTGMYTKTMPGGGQQFTPSASKISTETIIS